MSRKRVFPDVWRDSTGAVAVVLAVTLPVFVGGLGLGAEVGYWYFGQRKVQNAADVAAYAGAVALRAGVGESKMDDAAGDAAAESGFRVDRGEIEVVTPPTTGTYAGDTNAVEVRLVERLPRLFSAIFKSGEVDVPGRAVALVGAGQPTCVLALDGSASGAVTFTGSTGAILVGCNVHANSLSGAGVIVSGSATVETPCLSSSGGVSVTSGLTLTECVTPYINADVAADPYADVSEPDITQPETTPNVFGGGAGATYSSVRADIEAWTSGGR
jgi:Putative Flp pilus-assembly TadE/G-like